jgi:SIR2-like domain
MTRKKKLLIILGAGSSLPFGMPSVACLGREMHGWSCNWLNAKDESGPATESCFGKVWDSIERYYQSSNRTLDPKLQPQVNFEKALGDMLALAHWMMPAPYGATLRQIVRNDEASVDLQLPFDTARERYGPAILINAELSYLLSELAKHMRSRCRDFNDKRDDFRSYETFFDALWASFDVGIYNLNYDDLALRAYPDAFTGFGPDGFFDSNAVCSRANWDFIYHLHGSVHHTLASASSGTIKWQRDLQSAFIDDHGGRWTETRSDGRLFQASTLVAGGFKLDQLLVEPFQSFYSTFVRHVHEADAILIGGYGFGDAHVNRTLQQRFRSAAERNLPRPPVAIIDSYGERTLGLIRYDIWSQNMCNALATTDCAVGARHMHVSEVHKLAVWFDGIVDVANCPDAVVSWLDNSSVEALKAALER